MLQSLSRQSLPAVIATPEEIDHLRTLAAAGLVAVDIPANRWTRSGYEQDAATVRAITAEGRRWLDNWARQMQRPSRGHRPAP